MFTFFRSQIKMKTVLIVVSLAAIFFAKSIDALYSINAAQGAVCSSAATCGGLKHCCGGPPQGTYCAECCIDSNCRQDIIPSICVPGFNYFYKGPQHSRFCQPAFIQVSNGPCFRNDMCQSGKCINSLGFSGDRINLPIGTCE